MRTPKVNKIFYFHCGRFVESRRRGRRSGSESLTWKQRKIGRRRKKLPLVHRFLIPCGVCSLYINPSSSSPFSRSIPRLQRQKGGPIESSAMRSGAAIFLCLLLAFLHRSAAQTCGSETFSSNKVYATCSSLPYLGATLHWTYNASSNSTVDVAYRAQESSSGWVAWAINPAGSGMSGANAFLAFHNSSGAVTVYTTKFTSTGVQPSDIVDGSLDFAVSSRQAEYANGYYTIYATLQLPNGKTKQNTVWQASTQMSGGVPYGHALSGSNVQSENTIDFASGDASSAGGVPRLHKKNIHGVLNAISWGIMMPVGIIIARYVKVFKVADPAWFYLHVACQCSGYIIGLSGWILGLQLGSNSAGVTYDKHRNLGIALFCLATLQVFALFVRPNKDNKYRIYWNVYHHSVGYSIVIMSVVNIFEGFDILDPADKWKNAYIAVIATLGGIALLLEAVTWPIVIRRKRSGGEDKSHHAVGGLNGYA